MEDCLVSLDSRTESGALEAVIASDIGHSAVVIKTLGAFSKVPNHRLSTGVAH
jgi:hypothetical protein